MDISFLEAHPSIYTKRLVVGTVNTGQTPHNGLAGITKG